MELVNTEGGKERWGMALRMPDVELARQRRCPYRAPIDLGRFKVSQCQLLWT